MIKSGRYLKITTWYCLKKYWQTKSVNEIWPVLVILLKKKILPKKLYKNWPENQFQALLYLQRINHKLHWKIKFLQPVYFRYVIARLSKFVKVSKHSSSGSFFTEDFLKIKKALELVSRPHCYSVYCIYFPSYSVRCVSCFILRHLMTSWHLTIWKVKIWLSQEGNELSKWDKKLFFLFHKCSLLHLQKEKLAKI